MEDTFSWMLWLKRMRVPEMFLLGLSVLYGLGLLVLVQHHSLLIGYEDFNIVRVKPIIVGIEYLFYLAIPIAVGALPVIWYEQLLRRRNIDYVPKILHPVKNWKWIMGSLTVIALLMFCFGSILGVTFHYFFPYIVMKGYEGGLARISWLFWKIYFFWGGHLIGFLLIFSGFAYGALARRFHWRRHPFFVFFCVVCGAMFNLYFFNLNVYMNIAQSAGGGAPRIGVVTIMNPTAQIKHGAGEYIYEDGTVTKPCILLHENDEFTYLADLHDSQMSDPELSHCIRIPKASIAHFAQLSCAFWRRNGFVYDFVEWLDGDPVYNLSAEFILKAKASEAEPLFLLETNEVDCVPGITIVSENMKSNIGSTNMVCVQSMEMGRDLSNAVVMIRFPHMSCSWGRNVVDLSASLNMKGYVDVCGLPRLNPAHEWSLDEFSITANFIRKIVSCSLSKNEIAKQSLLREGCVSFLLGLATQCRTDEDVVR